MTRIEQAYKELLKTSAGGMNDASIAAAVDEFQKIDLEVNHTAEKFGYEFFPDASVHMGAYGRSRELDDSFLCHNQGAALARFAPDQIAVVTGFGTTGSPSPGTLSMIFRLLDIQKNADIYVSTIISDFGTLNSRNTTPDASSRLAEQFIGFIAELGFDAQKGELRTHKNKEYCTLLPIVTSCLSSKDFDEYTEATDDQYKKLNIFRGDFAMCTYKAMMATDILLPLVVKGKKAVVVITGLEEHYHPNFARFVGERFKILSGGYETLLPDMFHVSAFYTKMINGFFPYAKMSRSIPGSSLCIGDSESEIISKVRLSDKISNIVILQMMESMPGWSKMGKDEISNAFEDEFRWKYVKEDFLEMLLGLRKKWLRCAPKKYYSFVRYAFGVHR